MKRDRATNLRGASEFMSDEMGIEKIDLDKVDWRGSRDFFESLGEALDKLDDKDESYDFTWVGKRKSIIEAGAPINKTLRPDVANSKNWDTTENLFIEGDNLDALKLLQESYLGKVKMIYIDPPYNTGKDFVYHDNFKAEVEEYDEAIEYKDQAGNIQFKKNDKSNGRYHSDWLSMMYPRLKLARNLLSQDGIIFISIDDNEQENLKKLCSEIFGEDNFVAQLVWHLPRGINAGYVARAHEYIIAYARDIQQLKPFNQLSNEAIESVERANKKIDSRHPESILEVPAGIRYEGPDKTMRGDIDGSERITIIGEMVFENGKLAKPATLSAGWTMKNMFARWAAGEEVLDSKGQKIVEFYFKENGRLYSRKQLNVVSIKSVQSFGDSQIARKEMEELLGSQDIFSYPKPTLLAKTLSKLVANEGDMILDFFSGSGTTAHAVMQLNAEDGGNRKWIMVQLPEDIDEKSEAFSAGFKTIPEIARERIRRAGDKIAAEYPEATVDFGFRALRIDDTNYKEVYKPAGEQQQSTLLNLVDNIKDDRSELDLLYGVITQSALELNRPLETLEIAGSNVFLYDYFGEVSGLVACFGDSISEETIKEIAKLKPLTAVFRDSTFPDSQAKVNLGEHFRILSAETKVKVI